MLLDRDHLLLRDEAVPAAERLGVVGGIGVIGGHVGAHDARGVAGDVEAGPELVLGAHAGDILGTDRVPATVLVANESASLRSEEHTSELQSLMRTSYAAFCLKN